MVGNLVERYPRDRTDGFGRGYADRRPFVGPPRRPGARGPQSGTRGRGDREDRRRARIARGRAEVVPSARWQLRRGRTAGGGASTDAGRHVERGSSGLERAHVVEADRASRPRQGGSRFDRADARRRRRPERDDPRAPEDHPRHPEDGSPFGRDPEDGRDPGRGTRRGRRVILSVDRPRCRLRGMGNSGKKRKGRRHLAKAGTATDLKQMHHQEHREIAHNIGLDTHDRSGWRTHADVRLVRHRGRARGRDRRARVLALPVGLLTNAGPAEPR